MSNETAITINAVTEAENGLLQRGKRSGVSVTTNFMSHVHTAKARTYPRTTKEDTVRAIYRAIEEQVRDEFMKFDEHGIRPFGVDITKFDSDNDAIHATVWFDDPEAAMRFKLAHGGEA